MQKQISKSNILSIVLTILLAISMALTFTLAAFSGTATIEGTITFQGNVTVTAYGSTDDTDDTGPSVSVDCTVDYNDGTIAVPANARFKINANVNSKLTITVVANLSGNTGPENATLIDPAVILNKNFNNSSIINSGTTGELVYNLENLVNFTFDPAKDLPAGNVTLTVTLTATLYTGDDTAESSDSLYVKAPTPSP